MRTDIGIDIAKSTLTVSGDFKRFNASIYKKYPKTDDIRPFMTSIITTSDMVPVAALLTTRDSNLYRNLLTVQYMIKYPIPATPDIER
jgi:hypothetical protein